MDSTISPEKAKAKVIGQWAMFLTGIWMTVAALAASWLAFSPAPEAPAATAGSVPHFDRIARLASLDHPAARRMAVAAAKGILALEDKERGGFWRGDKKRLFDQAEAVKALKELDPDAARRTLVFVERRLIAPDGGYFSGEGAGGVDRVRSPSAQRQMALAVVAAGPLASPSHLKHARRYLELP